MDRRMDGWTGVKNIPAFSSKSVWIIKDDTNGLVG